MTRALVMAGGTDDKWGGYLGVRRHFAPIDGEPLLGRIVRQLHERGMDVHIVAPDLPEYHLPGTMHVIPSTQEWGMETVNAVASWDTAGRTILVYGDTVFSEAAMDTITGYAPRTWQLFGRFGTSATKPYGEIFAISFWPQHHGAWLVAMSEAVRLKARHVTRRAGAWEAFRILGGARGRRVSQHRRYPSLMTEIDDATDDIDTPAEYEALRRILTH